MVEDPMKLKVVTAAFALVGALALLASTAEAQTNQPTQTKQTAKKKTVVSNRDHTSAGLLNTQSALPGPWTLPFKSNPWLGY
jgi:hypothetical protein